MAPSRAPWRRNWPQWPGLARLPRLRLGRQASRRTAEAMRRAISQSPHRKRCAPGGFRRRARPENGRHLGVWESVAATLTDQEGTGMKGDRRAPLRPRAVYPRPAHARPLTLLRLSEHVQLDVVNPHDAVGSRAE